MAETKSRKKLMSGSNPFLRNKDLGPQSLLRAFFCVMGYAVRMGEEVGGMNKIKRGERAGGACEVECCLWSGVGGE